LRQLSSVIYCNQLVKNYGAKRVLKGLDLEVPKGTIFALLGTNGAGKTTLIRTLLGLIPSSGGEIKVLGEEPYRFGSSLRQRIGYVSEEQGLYGWMSINDIISFCKGLYNTWDDELVNKYIKRFGLNPKTKIGTLSKGQTTKLALILALGPKPELLILDEPMSGLDPLAQHEFLQILLKDVDLSERTVFFSTHNLADVEAIAKLVAIEYDGKIQAYGTIDSICAQVAKIKLPGSIPENLNLRSVLLEEDSTGKTYLIPSQFTEEIAAAGENTTISVQPVALKEAFLFFCSGGEQR